MGRALATVNTGQPFWWVAGEGDFDGDGASDLLWRNADGRNTIWRSANAATQLPMHSVPGIRAVEAVGDFDVAQPGDRREHDLALGKP